MHDPVSTKKQTALNLWSWSHGLIPLILRSAVEAIQQPFYSLYERYLDTNAHLWDQPRHIGIIMDGNRRFARMLRAADVAVGHQKGADKLREMLDWCFSYKIPVVTVWGFSLDNFSRNREEVQSLLELFEEKTLELLESSDLHDNQVRVRFIGRIDLLPDSLRAAIQKLEQATAGYDRFILNIALAYGGREEISDALRDYLAHMAKTGRSLEEAAADFSPETLERYLYTSGLPEPDLIVRTSGEVRLSGFMLWQSANSEFYFCDTNWPAFRKIDFLRALRSYDQRQRRFGR